MTDEEIDMVELFLMVGCAMYFVILIVTAGTSAPFVWFWLALAIALGALYVFNQLRKRQIIRIRLPLWLRVSFWTTVWLVAGLIVLVEAMVVIHMFSRTDAYDLDYLIVLGTYVEDDQPSTSLKQRLDTAMEYMEVNEDIIVIVSGGKGTEEQLSEAYVMATYLMNNGVDSERILMEDKATSTRENLIFSFEMIPEDASVGVVTNSFHVYRAMALAKKLDLDNVKGIAAPSQKLLLPSNMAREFFVTIKEKIMGYI